VKEYPYLIVDALYEKIRIQKKRMSQEVLIVVGIGEDGYREILAIDIANTKTKKSWSKVFQHLKERRLKEVKLVVSDNHKGLREAITRYFQGVLWQRCQFHFLHNLLNCVAKE